MPQNRTRRSTEPVFTEPQRLHKVLAQCGYGSLRGLEEMIIAGRITVNRMPAEVGQKVGPNDQIRINGELVRLRFAPTRARVLLYHKPAGEIVSRADPEGRPTVFDKLPRVGGAKWIAVGRLDFNSEGLLLFTTSGELANRLMHPRYEVEREYSVRIIGTLTPEQERSLREGVTLEDGVARVTSLSDEGGEGTNHWYKVTLPEGRNREIRRIFEALGIMVSRLIRIRYGVVTMPPQLKRGQHVELEQVELQSVLQAAGMANGEQGAGGEASASRSTDEADRSSDDAADDVVMLLWSEFGRRVKDNGSGTDHGAGGVSFLIGESIKGGIYGEFPSLKESDLLLGNLQYNNDFRSTYSTILERWFQVEARPIVNGSFEQLAFV